jgi:hypothetical protein
LAALLVVGVAGSASPFGGHSGYHYEKESDNGEGMKFDPKEVKIVPINMTSDGTPTSKVYAPGIDKNSPHMHLDDFIGIIDGHHDYEGGVLHNPNATSHLESPAWTGREDDQTELDHYSTPHRSLLSNKDDAHMIAHSLAKEMSGKDEGLRNDMTTSAFICLQLDIPLNPFCPICKLVSSSHSINVNSARSHLKTLLLINLPTQNTL